MDQNSFYILWQKLSFELVHKTTIWVLLVLLVTAGSAWQLGKLLHKHNGREQETKLAQRIAFGYSITTLVLWLFSFIMK